MIQLFLVSLCAGLIVFASLSLTSPSKAVAQEKKSDIIDRAYFFKNFRKQFGRISENQTYLIDRYERVFVYWDSQPHLKDMRWLAYILATTYHETGRKIKAVRECFGKTDQASINCVTRLYRRGRIKRNYAKIDPKTGKSYFGRGHVQLTWAYNYKRMGKELGRGDEVYVNPDLALHPDSSVAIMAQGMIKGLFTGKRLSQYFNGSTTNWGGARRIVNGLDKYKTIGSYGRKFHATLRTIKSSEPTPTDCTAETVPQSCLGELAAKVALLDTRYDELDARFKNLSGENKIIQDKFASQQTELEDLRASQPEIAKKLADLKLSHTELQNKYASLETEKTTLETKNTELAATNIKLQTDLDDAIATGSTGTDGEILKKRLEELKTEQAQLKKAQEILDTKVKDIETKTAALAQKEATVKDQLADIELSRDALQKRETNLVNDRVLLGKDEKRL